MFNKQKPLPTARITPANKTQTRPKEEQGSGILIGDNCYWNPEETTNPHGCIIGASGSGKTQTVKGIAKGILKKLPTKIIIIDFHGDQEMRGETCYELDMISPHGINPLMINLDKRGGGPNIQSIQVGMILKKTLGLGPNQQGMILEIINKCYSNQGIYQDEPETWTREPPNFDDIEEELNRRASTQFKSEKIEKIANSINPNNLEIGQPKQSGIYFVFDENKLIYIGSTTNIHRRTTGHHHILTPIKEKGINYTIRHYLYPSIWLELLTLENYLISQLKPTLNTTELRKECKESIRLRTKLAETFQFKIFSKPQPNLNINHIRIDLSKLPGELAAIAADSLAKQIMNNHKLSGESNSKIPRTILFIDEAKEMTNSKACDRISADGRKYGLGLWVATQKISHLSDEIIGNTNTKIFLPVDASDCSIIAKKFKLNDKILGELEPLNAIVRIGNEVKRVKIKPYHER